jgi:hypothetical protein
MQINVFEFNYLYFLKDFADKNSLIQIARLILASFATTEDLVDLRLRAAPDGAEARVIAF